jgi:hypothetical protein
MAPSRIKLIDIRWATGAKKPVITTATAIQNVVSGTAPQDVSSITACQHVIPNPHVEDEGCVTAGKSISPTFPEQPVTTSPADDHIVHVTTLQHVIEEAARNLIRTAEAADDTRLSFTLLASKISSPALPSARSMPASRILMITASEA